MYSVTRGLSAIAVHNLLIAAGTECPDVSFGMRLQAYAGLRSPEIVELLSEYHPDGGSINFNNNMIIVTLGLKKTTIPEEFTEYVITAYRSHMDYLKSECVDIRCPLFVNSKGTALSVDGYLRRVKQFGDFILCSSDASLSGVRDYLIETNSRFTGDMLRHWYAVNIMQKAIESRRRLKP